MKKTNLRMNNFFVIEDGKQYFLTTIDELDEWKKKHDDLKKLKKNDVTKKLRKLMNHHNIYANVNFFVSMNNDEEDIKVVDLEGGG